MKLEVSIMQVNKHDWFRLSNVVTEIK